MKRHIPAAAIIASLLLSGLAFAQTPAAPAARPGPATPAPAAAPPAAPTPPPASTTTAAPPARPAASGSNVGFPSEAAAKAACPTDTVAWANPSSKVLHAAGTKYYGKTARGSYMCQTQALGAGYHLSGSKTK